MNRLAGERSPYLLQHKDNPVDWYPWGEEAFERARREDKPIFLSIGYSTCHWCHVMAHESFEHPAIAEALNRDFVSIKVDREERPDVDRVYMAFVQATTGAGGWPMSVFLTPDLRPFYGGTYFPPVSRWNRPGFADVLAELARVWKHDRDRVNFAAGELFDRLRVVTGADGGAAAEQTIAGVDALDTAVIEYQDAFDARHGGFGGAPKFPRPAELLFLLREHARREAAGSPSDAPLVMATETLRAMAYGGVRDHIGGGFHHYSVDAEWRVPHFEKMLYDQAQLVLAYLEAAQATGDDFYATVAEDTLAYVLRDLTDPLGGFYSAEDADSLPADAGPGAHTREGAFYVWTVEEFEALLGDDAPLAIRRFGLEPGATPCRVAQGEFTGKNILYIAQTMEEIAVRSARPATEVADALGRARERLAQARAARPRPHLDDKILTAWNGLMIGALARAGRVLAGSAAAGRYVEAARRAARFVRERLWDAGTRRLLRRYRDGEAGIHGFAEDYAFMIFGLLELFQADGDPEWLSWAIALQERQDEQFWDEREGGWFSTDGEDPTVLLRLKEEYDGAEPSPGSMSVLNLLTLHHLGADLGLDRAERTLARYGPRLGAAARVLPMMLAALSAWHATHAQVVIVGGNDDEGAARLRAGAAAKYRPFAVTVPVEPGPRQEAIAVRLPFVGGMRQRDGLATAYVCRDFTCLEPVTAPEALAGRL